ncbi:hypothetical protein FGG08_002866 [Glutinoglossum americanum]|uniref:Pre-mRNA splicing factor CLF1 n=1 Tax=Glutinoglossum americanum TaxID=1670608 RepID=A0A9P8I3R0_9PEZI|nr:hypothetical protein FGG08_002866 [Glutinoglossum americanum]
MPPPSPSVELHDHCSVIYQNTLYVYSPDAFQSLHLSEGSKWEVLPMGVSATGVVCVNAVQGESSTAALYIVGGSTNSSTQDYSGLQRYLFADRKWETISPLVHVTQNRRGHGSVYLESSSNILIYAGSQDGNFLSPSSQTFLVSTIPPYSVTSYSSAAAPPLVEPILLPWDASRAVLLGGSEQNKQLFTFDPQAGWVDLGLTLDQGLSDRSQVQAVIINSSSGNKFLEVFNMNVSPNTVKRVCLQCSGNGSQIPQPAATPTPAQKREMIGSTTKRRKRDATAADWPPYNGTLAPKVTRTGYALAQGSSGLIVVTGGNKEDPLCMFDSTGNQWVNATNYLGGQAIVSIQSFNSPTQSVSSTSQTPLSTPSSTPSSESSAAASGSASSKPKLPIILGTTLGAIAGVALILAIILMLLRWQRKKREHFAAGHLRRASGPPGEKDRMSFADRGASFMREAGGFMSHGHHSSMNSQSSHAIITGRVFQGHRRGLFSKGNSSFGSGIFSKGSRNKSSLRVDTADPGPGEKGVSFALTNTAAAPAAGARAPGAVPIPRVPNSTDGSGKQRSSGWSRYFSGNPGTNLMHMNSGRSTYTEGSRSSDSHSQYSESRVASQRVRESMTVPPLHYGRFSSGENLNNVPSASPTIRDSAADNHGTGLALTACSAEVRRPGSVSTISSSGREDAFSSGIPASIHEPLPWSPVARPERDARATSSIYTDSARNTTIQRDSAVTMFPMPGPGVTVTDFDMPHEGPRNNTDMSWLNLSGSARP